MGPSLEPHGLNSRELEEIYHYYHCPTLSHIQIPNMPTKTNISIFQEQASPLIEKCIRQEVLLVNGDLIDG